MTNSVFDVDSHHLKGDTLKTPFSFSPTPRIHGMRNRYFLVIDLLIFVVTPIMAILIRREGSFEFFNHSEELVSVIAFFAVIKFVTFLLGGMYWQMWRHASVDELAKIGLLGLFIIVGQTLAYSELSRVDTSLIVAVPRSVPVIDGILTLFFVGAVRFSARYSERIRSRMTGLLTGSPVLVVGAGDAGILLVGEMQSNPQLGLRPIGFVDDDPHKRGLMIRGVRVLGDRTKIPELAEEFNVEEIIIAMPTAPGSVIREIDEICVGTGRRTRTIPGVFELLDGSVNIKKLRDVAIEDLLRREPVKIDDAVIRSEIQGRRVLITGAGGSIGGELCRQVARYGPGQVILLGHGENSIFEIAAELSHTYPEVAFSTVLADVRDRQRLSVLINRYKPELVYHAAAHKHVSLMELNPSEAVTNNIVGTLNLVEVCAEANVLRFVLISTDKAVNPTSVMGATKRVAELIVQEAARETGKEFVAVRFGNVLGSRGSVIPTFRKQIERGGPITVTHPDVKRYFMTIPEAVQLVLQAGSTGKGGEIYMLDMGEPVKIADLASDLVKLSGFEMHRDIEIVFTGLRQGEKLFEELVLDDEHFVKTRHEKIFVLKNGKLHPAKNGSNAISCFKDLQEEVERLKQFAATGDASEIRTALKKIVPEFQYQIPAAPL
jgi:FlaA1/EpsC-like NDP-sugar epimerase